ncbi:MAG: hypothetical protein VZS12_10110 [Ruminococcus bromii]|nr:hypothetical protein [Ruminococcus bromii]
MEKTLTKQITKELLERYGYTNDGVFFYQSEKKPVLLRINNESNTDFEIVFDESIGLPPITVCGNNHANVATVECSEIVYKAITDGKYKIIHN